MEHAPELGAVDVDDEPNPPNFGGNVFVVSPGDAPRHQATWDRMYQDWHGWGDDAQFGQHRTAVLLLPGTHKLDIRLPYYFSVVGVGEKPSDTIVQPGDRGLGLKVDHQGCDNSCNTFWRSIEGVEMTADVVQFWVSQAAPMRSCIVNGTLEVAGPPNYWSSGGALMNSHVRKMSMGTQQQWYTRGTQMPGYDWGWRPGSYVGVGCINEATGRPFDNSYDWTSPAANQYQHTGKSYTDAPEYFAEKPYMVFEGDRWYLQIPTAQRRKSGPTWGQGTRVPFENVYVASPDSTAATINAKIEAGKHVVFPPGIYMLDSPIIVNMPGTVLLGFGYATLVPTFPGEALVQVGDVRDVRVAGLLLHAGRVALETPALLQWGSPGSSYPGDEDYPGFIYDLVGRVGGPEDYDVGTKYIVQINSGRVIGDNVWLWSADHSVGGRWPSPYARVGHALEVNGAHVSMYGLFAEHTDGDSVVWNGEHGQTMFYQAEFRYTEGLRSNPRAPFMPGRHAAYRVNARDHKAIGFGMYVVVFNMDHKNQYPLSADGGFYAVAVKHWDTYVYGFKDISARNWNRDAARDQKITSVCWDITQDRSLDDGFRD